MRSSGADDWDINHTPITRAGTGSGVETTNLNLAHFGLRKSLLPFGSKPGADRGVWSGVVAVAFGGDTALVLAVKVPIVNRHGIRRLNGRFYCYFKKNIMPVNKNKN